MEDEITIERKIFPTSEEMGRAVGNDVGEVLRDYTVKRGARVVVMFAAAPSQDDFLAQLAGVEGIDWKKVIAVHMDEYVDLPQGHPNTFEVYLKEHLFSNIDIPEENVHYIKGLKGDAEKIAREYETLLEKSIKEVREKGGIYIVCMGIGVNGHIAFNEPHVDKRTLRLVIPVKIDETSVQQQYNDYKNNPDPKARYASLGDVPRNAVTASCSCLLEADRIYCTVPGKQKADAVKKMWDGPITDSLPASLLRLHPSATIYLDSAAASKLERPPQVGSDLKTGDTVGG